MDMVEIHKIRKSVEKVYRELLLAKSQNTKNKGHPLKLAGDSFNSKQEKVLLYVACS